MAWIEWEHLQKNSVSSAQKTCSQGFHEKNWENNGSSTTSPMILPVLERTTIKYVWNHLSTVLSNLNKSNSCYLEVYCFNGFLAWNNGLLILSRFENRTKWFESIGKHSIWLDVSASDDALWRFIPFIDCLECFHAQLDPLFCQWKCTSIATSDNSLSDSCLYTKHRWPHPWERGRWALLRW